RNAGGKQSLAGPTARDRSAELDRIQLDRRTTGAPRPAPAGRPGEDQRARLSVPSRPLRRDVGDEHAIVVGGQLHVPGGRRPDIASVHPRVTGQDDVVEVAETPLL